jgi:hypothetical protein
LFGPFCVLLPKFRLHWQHWCLDILMPCTQLLTLAKTQASLQSVLRNWIILMQLRLWEEKQSDSGCDDDKSLRIFLLPQHQQEKLCDFSRLLCTIVLFIR